MSKYLSMRSVAAVSVTASLLLAGCASDDSFEKQTFTPSGPAVAGQVQDNAFSGGQATLAGPGGSIQGTMMKIFNEFSSKSGAKIADDSPAETAKIAAQVQSGNLEWDLVVVPSDWAQANCGNQLQPWDKTRVDLSKLPDWAQASDCGIPVTASPILLAYDKRSVGANEPKTYADLFDTTAWPGKRAVPADEIQYLLPMALLADGVAPADVYPLDVDRAFKKLESIKNDLIFYPTNSASQQMMEGQQAVMCFCFSGRVYAANKSSGPHWAVATDTPIAGLTVMGLVKGSKNADVATGAMNYYLGKDQQETFQEETTYPAVNREARPTLNELAKPLDAMNPPFSPPLGTNDEYWKQNREALTDRWITWMNG